jgi:small subunit ribosomal protein S9
MKEKDKDKGVIFTTGKRKRAVARARIKPGKGIVKINSTPLEQITNEIARLKMQEPLLIIGDASKSYDINVNVRGGGIMGQADAARQAISRGFVKIMGQEVKQKFLSYDKYLLVYDPRRTEPHKPPHSSWGARRYKQRSKR